MGVPCMGLYRVVSVFPLVCVSKRIYTAEKGKERGDMDEEELGDMDEEMVLIGYKGTLIEVPLSRLDAVKAAIEKERQEETERESEQK